MKKLTAYQIANSLIYKIDDTIYINWKLVPCMDHLPAESLEAAKITSRINVNFLTRRAGSIPKEICDLLNKEYY